MHNRRTRRDDRQSVFRAEEIEKVKQYQVGFTDEDDVDKRRKMWGWKSYRIEKQTEGLLIGVKVDVDNINIQRKGLFTSSFEVEIPININKKTFQLKTKQLTLGDQILEENLIN